MELRAPVLAPPQGWPHHRSNGSISFPFSRTCSGDCLHPTPPSSAPSPYSSATSNAQAPCSLFTRYIVARRHPSFSHARPAAPYALGLRRRRLKKSNRPARDSSHRPQHPSAGKVEGKTKPEKSQRFDAHHQQPRGAMAGHQRYLRYIIFALIVCSSGGSWLNSTDSGSV